MCVRHGQLRCCKCTNSHTLSQKFLKHLRTHFLIFVLLERLRNILDVHHPRTSVRVRHLVNILSNLLTDVRVEVKTHLCYGFIDTVFHLLLKQFPIDTLLHTRKDEASHTFVFLETLVECPVIYTNSEIDKNNTIVCLHVPLNDFRFTVWVVVDVGDFILDVFLNTPHIETQHGMKRLHMTRLRSSDENSDDIHLSLLVF